MADDEEDRQFMLEMESAAKRLSFVEPKVGGHDLQAMIADLKAVVVQAHPEASPVIVPKLLGIAKSVRCIVGMKLAEIGLFTGQDELLLALDENMPLSISGLAEKLHVRPSTISKMVDRLAALEYVTRLAWNKDARRTMVEITPKGLDARSKVLLVHELLESDLGKQLGNDMASTSRSLGIVEDLLRSRLARLR